MRGGFTGDKKIQNGLQQCQLHMNFNRVELKWSQSGVKAINMEFKRILHVNVTYRPKEVRQVTHNLTRVLNFSIKRKINSPHSYIQLGVTPNKSSTQRKQKPKTERPAVPSCARLPRPVPWTRHSRAKQQHAHRHLLGFVPLSFLASPYHTPIFVLFFFVPYLFV